MKLKELIKELESYENKEVDVFVYFNDDLCEIDLVDLSISDRVDINIKSGSYL